MARLITAHRLKALTRKGARPDDISIRKDMVNTLVTSLGDRVLRYVISTPDPDREGDVVSVEGWDLTNYRKNPVVLWAHRQDHFPIGRCIDIGIEDGALKATVEFAPPDIPCAGDHAEAAFRLSSTGFLPGVSVGFKPIEYDIANDRDDGTGFLPPMNFLRQELLEFSLVSVPCHPDALLEPQGTQLTNLDPSTAPPEAMDDQELANRAAVEKAAQDAEDRRVRTARQRRARQILAGTL